MSQDHPPPPPQAAIFGLVSSVWAAQAVATFAKLGIADLLASGPKTAAELAAATHTDAGALHRLLRGVSSVNVLAQLPEGRFTLTPIGETLRKDVPGSTRSMIIAELAPGHWLPWGHLDESVRTGKPAAPGVLGMPVWEYYKKNAEEGAYFAEAMSGLSGMAMQAVLASYSFAGARKVVDVGGSHGAFLSAVLNHEPAAKGILYDLPEVVERARVELEAAGVSSRVERVGGSFFESVPKGGDVYLLKHILHDWSDAECVQILKNVRDAMAPEGRVVVVEMPIDMEGPPSPAPLLDLNMLVMLTGKERTAAEYGALFSRAGLKLAGVTPTPSPFAVLEARRA
ncbi:MAG TPA: methyltransferase [Polyangiaceae bacterium]|nr:methyltransferase [Polyangiaceae bacterium]